MILVPLLKSREMVNRLYRNGMLSSLSLIIQETCLLFPCCEISNANLVTESNSESVHQIPKAVDWPRVM